MDSPHILIIGAGITGLVLAQSLRKRDPAPKFSIFERDPTPHFRGAGWGLTIHWGLEDFLSLLPQDLIDRLPETFVDAEAVQRGETGHFLLFDLQTGEEKLRVPPSNRIRVSRERLRALLMDGLEIQWSKTLAGIDTEKEDSITAIFDDGSSVTGTLLIGADGARSQVRRILCPTTFQNHRLPVRLLGASVPYTKERCREIRALDPFFFQATDPATNAFHFFSFLSIPSAASSDPNCVCQIMISWPYDTEFLGKGQPTEIPESNVERVKLMKELTIAWISPFSGTFQDIPEGTEVKEISLEDWPPAKGMWDNANGRVTLVGDAAHAMTMYRGEAANHGITDVANLYKQLFAEGATLSEAVNKYEEEMIPRAKVAVLNSRRACLDAHDSKSINELSPLVARRVKIFEE